MRNVLRVAVCCSLTFGLSAGTTRAQCPPSPDQLSLRVVGSVRRDAASGMFAYSFQVASAPSSPQAAWTFGVEVPGSVSEVGKPIGWRGRELDVRPWVHWTAKTQESRIAPGAAVSGFSFLSPQPPGMTVFHASGYVAPPRVSAATEGDAEAAAETLVDRCPQLALPRIDQGISGSTIGPVDATWIGVEVKPGGDRTPIEPGSRGIIPVAILGSPSLEIGTIDRGSVRLVPSGAAPAQSSIEDVNGDGIRDLMLYFRTEDAQLTTSDSTVVLSARSTSGALLAGFDRLVTTGSVGEVNHGPLADRVRPALHASPVPAAPLSVTKIGAFTATPVDKPFDPFSCKGRMAPAERKIIDEAPSIEVDPSVPQEALDFDALEEGLLCSFAVSPDGRRSVVLLRAGRSYSVLFFDREHLVKAQRIHGPWMLHVKPGAYPPHLEQLAAGDAGFLFKFDRKSEAYRQVPYPYRPGSD